MLCWFMAGVSKGLCLGPEHVAWLLGVAEAIAQLPRRECPRISPGDRHDHFPLHRISRELKDADHQSLLYALQLRRSFGGMHGDMRMIDGLTQDWLQRLKAVELGEPGADRFAADLVLEVRSVAPESLSPLHADEWDLSAVDFHCTDIDEQLAADVGAHAGPRVLEGVDVRSMIWACSSSLNTKAVVPYSLPAEADNPALAKVWSECRAAFERLARKILAAKYSRNRRD
jgi:hypothetical protein